MNQKNNIEQARKALLAYMEKWSEDKYCAGWLNNLADIITEEDDKTFEWLVEESGGWYIYDKKFITGTFQDLLENGSGEK
jgi:hypothetical protein